LIPFVTRCIGESHFGTWAVAAYGAVLLLCAVAWEIERRVLLRVHGQESALARAMRVNVKEVVSIILYVVAIAVAFVNSWFSCALYGVVAAIWLVPDRRIEREIETRK
jgi:uncharacterized membrane protein